MIYSGTVLSKTGRIVPLFSDGKPMHSKYNPESEAQSFMKDAECGFIVAAGIGGGFHIENLLSRLSGDFFVLAVEADKESLDFCLSIPGVRELSDSGKISFCTADDFESELEKRYFPAAYPSFTFAAQRAWEIHSQEKCSFIKNIIEKKIRSLSADFSVQSHFGKIWQKNIMENLKIAAVASEVEAEPCTEKIAAVIAAGPSLDLTAGMISSHREDYVVFSTDTAYGPLVSRGIDPDYVLSIDGQFVSSGHFMLGTGLNGKLPCFVFDLCANHTAVNAVIERGCRVIFVKSFHPLCMKAAEGFGLLTVESGSGTVTIAACDFARQLGAKKIRVFGADFSYNGGKPYCRGTYLDSSFSKSASRIENPETRHCALMFRTELKEAPSKSIFGDKLKNPVTSPVLEGYGETLCIWARKYGFDFDGGLLVNPGNSFRHEDFQRNIKEFTHWMDTIKPIFEGWGCSSDAAELSSDPDLYPLFPYVAWLRKKDGNNKVAFFELLKLAYYQLRRYTVLYEK